MLSMWSTCKSNFIKIFFLRFSFILCVKLKPLQYQRTHHYATIRVSFYLKVDSLASKQVRLLLHDSYSISNQRQKTTSQPNSSNNIFLSIVPVTLHFLLKRTLFAWDFFEFQDPLVRTSLFSSNWFRKRGIYKRGFGM